jgi:parallel beta-helix repeat protein
MKKLIYLIVAIVVLGLIVSGCIPVVPPAEQNETSGLMKWNPPDLFVDDNYTSSTPGWGVTHFATISNAIVAAIGGNTIEVAGGTYTEAVTVNKSVTLLGANFDLDPAGGLDRGGESVIVGQVTITADDVTVNGFKLTSRYICAGYTSALNVNISYNILENVVATWGAIHLHGTASGPSYHECDGGYIGYNTISGAVGDGIWTVGNNDVTIEYNYILSSSGFASIQALNHVGTRIEIHGNTITNSGGKGINYWADDGGVITDNVITNSNYEAIYTDAQAIISGNQITGGNMHGIRVVGGAAGSTVSENTISNTFYEGIQAFASATITGNEISGCYHGIQIRGNATSYTVDGNNIHDNQYHGIEMPNYNAGEIVATAIITNNTITYNPYCGVKVGGNTDGSGYHINCNNFESNGIYGVESFTTANVDATHNWWGHASGPSGSGPGTGDAVSDNVNYDNWAYIPDFCDCEAKTIGYWKNHLEYVYGILAEVGDIKVGDVFVDEDLAELIFDKPNSKTYQMLAAQLLAAKLNVAQLSQFITGYNSACVDDAIVAADVIFEVSDYDDTLLKPEKAAVNIIKDLLDDFNNEGCPLLLNECPCDC